MSVSPVKLKANTHIGSWHREAYDVYVDDVRVGHVQKEIKNYSAIKGGGRYTYWHGFNADGEKIVHAESTRREAVAKVAAQ